MGTNCAHLQAEVCPFADEYIVGFLLLFKLDQRTDTLPRSSISVSDMNIIIYIYII